jgi:hypothetical protein
MFAPRLDELKNVTGHVIPGLWDEWVTDRQLDCLRQEKHFYGTSALPRYLILGYKFFRRGDKKRPERILKNIEAFKKHQVRLYSYLRHLGSTVSFDNLALEQLDIKQLIRPEKWDRLFMGEDGTRSMFIDAVEQTSAVSSTVPLQNRVAWTQKHPLTMFQEQHEP